MTRGRYPADRRRDLMNVAAAVVGSAAAAQVVNPRWVSVPYREADHSYHTHARARDCRCICDIDYNTDPVCPEHGEHAYRYSLRDRVVDAAREYARTGGEAHHELMDAVAALDRAERGE